MKYLPELLTDLWSLGCYPDLIVRLLQPLHLDSGKIHALDLGCGKGAAAITLAHEFGIHVTGIDSCESFLAEARKLSQKYHVSKLCNFELDDIRIYLNKKMSFDLIIYSSLGPLLGDLGETVGCLRRLIPPDGYIIIDDAFLNKNTPLKRPGYAHLKSHDESVNLLLKWGDHLISENQIDTQLTVQMNRTYINSMRKQARKLTRRIPKIKGEIESYINYQVKECHVIESHLTECIWLLQKK